MVDPHRKIRLGFAEGTFPEGVHICQIYADDDERNEALQAFLVAGLQDGERAICFSGRTEPAALGEVLKRHHLDMAALEAEGRFHLAGSEAVYFEGGRFDPDRMLRLLARFHDDSRGQGRAARVIGEMMPEIGEIEGGDRLMEYECRVSLLLQEKPVTTVCQYEAAAFDGATIMDVLRVHPMMVVRGEVVHNPFFVPPAEFLSR